MFRLRVLLAGLLLTMLLLAVLLLTLLTLLLSLLTLLITILIHTLSLLLADHSTPVVPPGFVLLALAPKFDGGTCRQDALA